MNLHSSDPELREDFLLKGCDDIKTLKSVIVD